MYPLVYGPFNLLCGAYRGHFPEVRRPGLEAIHSPPSPNEVKIDWHYTSTLPYDSKLCTGASLLRFFLNMGTLWYSSGQNLLYLHRLSESVMVKICHKLQFFRNIQGVYKWMVQFQKLTRNLFLTLHGHNVHRQQRQLSKFLMRYQQFAHSCLLRGCGASFQDGVVAGKGFLCAPFWGVQICDCSAAWVSCTV